MPGIPDRSRDSRLVWVIAAAPAVLLAVAFLIPSWRERLLRTAYEIGPPSLVAGYSEQAPTNPLRGATPAGTPDSKVPPPLSGAGVAPTTETLTVPASNPDPARLVLHAGAQLDGFLETAYRSRLVPGVGPLHATLGDGRMTLAAQLDLVRFRQSLRAALPDALAGLATGESKVEIDGRIVGSEAGIASVRLEGLRVGGIPVPTSLLAIFFTGELQARGVSVNDPLVRRIFLPPGFESGVIEGDRLELKPTAR